VLLVLGFFTCGFQLAFITVHLPAYLIDRGIPASTGGWVLAAIGLFNIIGSLSVGWLQKLRTKALHPVDHLFHARVVDRRLHFVPGHDLVGDRVRRRERPDLAVHGATDLGAGGADVRHAVVCDAVRVAFVSHQVGGFLGVWLGGIVFEKSGSYTPDLVAFGAVRRAVRADQFADRRGACPPGGCAAGLIR